MRAPKFDQKIGDTRLDILREMKALQKQLTDEFSQTRSLIKYVVTETQSVKKELEEIKQVLIEIRNQRS